MNGFLSGPLINLLMHNQLCETLWGFYFWFVQFELASPKCNQAMHGQRSLKILKDAPTFNADTPIQ